LQEETPHAVTAVQATGAIAREYSGFTTLVAIRSIIITIRTTMIPATILVVTTTAVDVTVAGATVEAGEIENTPQLSAISTRAAVVQEPGHFQVAVGRGGFARVGE